MGLLSRIFGAGQRQEVGGIRLDRRRTFWALTGVTDFPSLLTALPDLLPKESVLLFEGGSPSGTLLDVLRVHEVPARARVARGTLWPRPNVFHLPAAPETMRCLAGMMESRAVPELAIHFHVYRAKSVLLEWHDAFTQPMLLSGELPERQVRALAERLGMSCRKGERGGAAVDDKPRH